MQTESIIAMVSTEYNVIPSDIEVTLTSTFGSNWNYEVRIKKYKIRFKLTIETKLLK